MQLACDTLSMASMLSSHALHERITSPIPATLDKQRHRVLIVSTSFLIRPSLWVGGGGGEVETREGGARKVSHVTVICDMCVTVQAGYRCTVSVGGEGGGYVSCHNSEQEHQTQNTQNR